MKKHLLIAGSLLLLPGTAQAACVTTGHITANCDLNADTTGAITLDDGVTINTIQSLTVGNAISGTNSPSTAAFQTNGSGITLTLNNAIGATPNALGSFTLAADDALLMNGGAINTENDITLRGNTIINAATNPATFFVNTGNMLMDAGSITTIQDSTQNVDINSGGTGLTQLGAGAKLIINDGNNVTLGSISGAAADTGIMQVNSNYTSSNDIGALNRIASLELGPDVTLDTNNHAIRANTVTVAPGATLAISSGFIDFSISHYNIGIDTATHFGKIAMGNGDPLDVTGTDFIVDAAHANIAAGDKFNIVQAGSIIGGPGATPAAVADNSALFDFTLVGGAGVNGGTVGQLYLVASQSAAAVGLPSGLVAVAATLDSAASSTGNPQLQTLAANMNALGTPQALQADLRSIQPSEDGGVVVVFSTATITFQQVNAATLGHLTAMRDGVTGVAAGGDTLARHMWVEGLGSWANQGTRGGVPGYKADTAGGTAGVDRPFDNDDAHAGLAVTYANTGVNSKDVNDTSTAINSYQLTLYGDHVLPRDSFVQGTAGYAWNDIHGVRQNIGGAGGFTGVADYAASQFSAHAETGRNYKTDQGFVVTPKALANYLLFLPHNYTETGAGGASLHVDGSNLQLFELGGGVEAAWNLKQTDGAVFRPRLGAGYRYDLIGDSIDSTAQFVAGGSAFETQGPKPARGAFNAGTSLEYVSTANWQLKASYDVEHKQEYASQTAELRATLNF